MDDYFENGFLKNNNFKHKTKIIIILEISKVVSGVIHFVTYIQTNAL